MGRDYLHGTGKNVRVGGGGRSGGGGGDDDDDPNVTTGCMSSVFRIFDFHHFHLCYHQQHFNTYSSTPQSLTGFEAPRNSFESLEDSLVPNPLTKNLTFPQMSVKTKRTEMQKSLELSEDSLSSPGNRTPSLVARLMGLDNLPTESSSPAFSTTKTQTFRKLMKHSGTQSLPDSPRASLTRWSDVDLHHRLSFQVSKKESNRDDDDNDDEALCKRKEMIKSLVKNSEVEGWSPGHYAKQIVKQVKESVGRSRRVGLVEITNNFKGRETVEHRRDEHLLPAGIKNRASKKNFQKKTVTNFSYKEDVENQAPVTSSYIHKEVPLTTKRGTTSQLNEVKEAQKLKCRKAMEDKFKFTSCQVSEARDNGKKKLNGFPPLSPCSVMNQHRNKSPLMSKKTQLSTKQFNITTTAMRTSLHRIKQVVVASHNQKGHHHHHHQQQQQQQLQLEKQIDFSEAKTQTVGVHETISLYISKILKCMGIGNHTYINTITNWYSTSNPLNPSIFNLLEPISSSTNLIPQCNRRLIFQLTDEILSDILYPTTPYNILKIIQMNGDQLVKLLTLKIESFPLSNCQILQDVDALIGFDYDRVGSLDDENRSVVRELEREILDCLLFETTSLL